MTEAWLRGPVAGVPEPLMPAAHALMDAGEELEAAAAGLAPALVWARPGGVASVGFHLRHVVGSLDRLLTYARGEALTADQLRALAGEADQGEPPESVDVLLGRVREAIQGALHVLRETAPETLADVRKVGRAQLPSTVGGLLFHAAEHTRRHAGQVIATTKILKAGAAWPDPRLVVPKDGWDGGPVRAVRRARAADREALVRMRMALWPDSTAEEVDALLTGANPSTVLLVADEDGRGPCAFAEVGLRAYAEGCATSPVAYLEGVWVEPDVRRTGVGRALVAATARWAVAAGCSEVASDAEPANAASLTFHGAVGFEEAGRSVCYRATAAALVRNDG